MTFSGAFSDVTLERMALAYKSALQELQLDSMAERESLATCILSIGNSSSDHEQLLERAVQLFHRAQHIKCQWGNETTAIRLVRKLPDQPRRVEQST